MQCHIFAVGQKMPKWCVLGCEEYAKRLSRFIKCTLFEIPAANRHKSICAHRFKEEEGSKILQKISRTDYVIALEVHGQLWSSEALATQLETRKQHGQDLIFIIGGPDGLSKACLERANARWSLSKLTFPHALARLILLEQLYRAASILANHPYHRE